MVHVLRVSEMPGHVVMWGRPTGEGDTVLYVAQTFLTGRTALWKTGADFMK